MNEVMETQSHEHAQSAKKTDLTSAINSGTSDDEQQISRSVFNTDSTKEGENSDKKPPDGGWGWVVVVGCMFGHLLMVGIARSFGLIYVVLMEIFSASAASTAWVNSLYNFCRMFTGPLVSRLCVRFGCRRVVICGSVVITAGFIASAYATSVTYLCISFGIIAGLGGGFIFTPMFVMLSDYFERNKGKAMAFSTLGSGLGTVAMAPLIGYLLHEYSFSGAMLIIGGLIMNFFAIGGIFRPVELTVRMQRMSAAKQGNHDHTEEGDVMLKESHMNSTASNTAAEENHAVLGETDETHGKRDATDEAIKVMKDTNDISSTTSKASSCCQMPFVQLLKNSTFVLYCVLIISMPYCIQGAMVFVPPRCKELGISSTHAALLLSLMGAADMVGRFIFGFIFDIPAIIPYRRPLHSVLGIAMGASVMSFSALSSLPVMVVGVLFWGIFESGFHSQRATIQSTFIDKSQLANVVGYMVFCQGIGNLTSATLGGFLADTTGTFKTPFLLGGAFSALASAAFLVDHILKRICFRSGIKKSSTNSDSVTKL